MSKQQWVSLYAAKRHAALKGQWVAIYIELREWVMWCVLVGAGASLLLWLLMIVGIG